MSGRGAGKCLVTLPSSLSLSPLIDLAASTKAVAAAGRAESALYSPTLRGRRSLARPPSLSQSVNSRAVVVQLWWPRGAPSIGHETRVALVLLVTHPWDGFTDDHRQFRNRTGISADIAHLWPLRTCAM